METQPPLAPWRQVALHAIGGLEMVGFAENLDVLLVVSSNGRGLFDCLTGMKVARDYGDDSSWYSWEKLSALGIDLLGNQPVHLAGLYGGGLIKMTQDGWSLESIAPTWPDYRVILCPPSASIYENHSSCVQVEQDYEIRAFGFSETGRSFVIALNHSLYIYSRE